MKKYLLLLMAALIIVSGCSRTKPLDNDSPEDESSDGSSETLVPNNTGKPNPKKMNVVAKEAITESIEMYYAVPGGNEGLEESSRIITEKIEGTISVVSENFNMGAKDAKLMIYDNVNKNTEGIFSVGYDGVYYSTDYPKGSKFAYGLTFNVKTGAQIPLDTVIAPHTLAKLIMEATPEQIISHKDDAQDVVAHIQKIGISTLADRIVAAQEQNNIDQLLAFSYYLEEEYIVAVLPLDNTETGDYAFIRVAKAK